MLTLDESWSRPRPTPAQLRSDLVAGVTLVALSLLSVELLRATPGGVGIAERPAEAYLWSVAVVAPLLVRRRFPVTVMVLCSAAFYVTGERVVAVGYSLAVQVALFASIYTAWAWSRHRRALIAWSAVVVLGMFAWLVEVIVTTDPPAGVDAPGLISTPVAIAVMTLGINVVYFFGAIAWGSAAHRSARQRELLEEQTRELRRERDLSARRAVVDERLRIARDLHDVVAHHVTGIGVQAAAARHVMDRDPAGSREALAAIEGSSRTAVHEMHQLVGLLREDEQHGYDDGLAPTLTSVRDLAGGHRDPSLRVGYRELGEPFPVPPSIGRSAYRIVQEALTNVRRHSTAREADVALRFLDGAVEVEILDDGSPRRRGAPSAGATGFGLQGIRERVELHGGEHEIGPRPGTGFRVRARLPVDRGRA